MNLVIFHLTVFPEGFRHCQGETKRFSHVSLFKRGMTVSYIILYFKRVHGILCVKKLNYRKIFLESPGNVSATKSNIQIKI